MEKYVLEGRSKLKTMLDSIIGLALDEPVNPTV